MVDGEAGAAAGPAVNFRLSRTLTGHTRSVASVKFAPNGQWCAILGAPALWALPARF